MAYVKLVAPLAVFLLATFLMFPMKKVEAVDCSGFCTPFKVPPCGTLSCRCIPIYLLVGICIDPIPGVVIKMVKEHPNLCQSDADCMKKESGSFCARYANPDIEYGWCFISNSEAEDFFNNIASNPKAEDFFKNIGSKSEAPPPIAT